MKILGIEVKKGVLTRKHVTATSKALRELIRMVYNGYANVSTCIRNRYGVRTVCVIAYEVSRNTRIVRARVFIDDGKAMSEYLVTVKI